MLPAYATLPRHSDCQKLRMPFPLVIRFRDPHPKVSSNPAPRTQALYWSTLFRQCISFLLATKKAHLGRGPYPYQMQQHSQNFVYRLLAGSNNEIQVQFIVTPSKPGHTSSTTAQAYGGPQSITLVPPTVENSRREQREPCRAST